MGQLSGVGFKRALASSPCANERPLNTAGKTKATARAKKFRPNFILAPPHQRSVPQRRFKLIHSRKISLAQRYGSGRYLAGGAGGNSRAPFFWIEHAPKKFQSLQLASNASKVAAG